MAMAPRPYWRPVGIKGSIGAPPRLCQPTTDLARPHCPRDYADSCCARFPQPMTSARFPVSGGNCPSQCFANVACRSRRRNIAISRISDGLFCSGNVGRSRRFSIEQAGHGNIQSLCNFDAGCECWALFCDRATSVECCAGSERIRPMPPHSHPPPPQGMQ